MKLEKKFISNCDNNYMLKYNYYLTSIFACYFKDVPSLQKQGEIKLTKLEGKTTMKYKHHKQKKQPDLLFLVCCFFTDLKN
jgi:hypothetical protein